MTGRRCKRLFAGCLAALVSITGSAILQGCDQRSEPLKPSLADTGSIRFQEVARQAGLEFPLGHHGKSPLTILDSLGQGGAFVDVNGDGWLDVLLVSDQSSALFQNLRNGKFRDVTREWKAACPGYWHGVATGDIDNDGDLDVCLVGYRSLALLRNERDHFGNVTPGSGLAKPLWGSSAAFADLDGDGRQDLVVGEYLEFGTESVQHCTVGAIKTACGPKIYSARHPRVYRNTRTGFQDVTRTWGFSTANGKALGITFGDFNSDRLIDVAIANDEMPQDLFVRQPGSKVQFRNIGTQSGFSFLTSGRVQSGMGIDAADFNRDGTEDLIITNFQNEPAGLYRNENSFFQEVSGSSGVSEPTFPYVGWGVRFLDADNDADLDLLIANGHIQDNVQLTSATATYPEPLLLLANDGRGQFYDEAGTAGPAFRQPVVGRGLVAGDYDNDGRMDALIVNIEGSPLLLHNESPANHWLGLELLTGNPPRPAVGAVVSISVDGVTQRSRVSTAGSIFSAHDSRLHFGLGLNAKVPDVRIEWPNGARQQVGISRLDQYHRIVQRSTSR